MLKPFLLLCWAATIVSAGDPKNIINDTSVPTNSDGDNVATDLQSPLGVTKPLKQDAHVPSIVSKLNADTKSSVPISILRTLLNEHVNTTDDYGETSHPTTPPTTKGITASVKLSTIKPITIKPITTTTTPIPTTTAVPTTPAPTTPLPPPSTGKWVVEGDNNTLCIVVQIAAQFNVSYTNANNMTIHRTMDIPSNGTTTGKCGKTEQNLTLSWVSQGLLIAQDNFTLHFVKNETDKHYSLHHLEISLVPDFLVDKSNKTVTLVHMAPQFKTGLSNSYRCLKEQSLNLTLEGKNETVGVLKVSNLQFQAFRGDNTTVFGLAKDCSFDTPDIVPITVGCALAGLVVIVLIAYLVGRRRSQARGYLSM